MRAQSCLRNFDVSTPDRGGKSPRGALCLEERTAGEGAELSRPVKALLPEEKIDDPAGQRFAVPGNSPDGLFLIEFAVNTVGSHGLSALHQRQAS